MENAPSPWRVRARNIATDSENRIHDDTVARRYGFAGGLVPGVVVYGYLVRPVVEALGRDWLGRGRADVRLVSPCYDGESLVVRASEAEARPDEAVAFELVAERPAGVVCARGRAALLREAAEPPGLDGFPVVPMPNPKHPPSIDALRAGTDLGSLVPSSASEKLEAFAGDIGDDLPAWSGSGSTLHPGAILQLANELLARSVALGPWIHVESEVVHFAPAPLGEAVGVRGRIVESFARKGHEFAVIDALVLAAGDRPRARIRHTAIVRPRERA